MNKRIKDAYIDIKVSKKLEKNILNKTVNKEIRKNHQFKIAYVGLIAIGFCLLSITMVYAKDIKNYFKKWSTSVQFDEGTRLEFSQNNNFKYIPIEAIKVGPNDESIKMSYQEIEEMLKFPILKLSKNNPEEIYYHTYLNDDNSIGRIDLWMPYFLKYSEDKYLHLSVDILNKYADEGYILAFQEGIDATGEKNIEKKYKSDNLNTNIIIYTNTWSKKRITATFVYDDILYRFIGNNITKEEIISIIESLIY